MSPESVRDELDRADRAIRSANLLMTDDDIVGAVERAYYGMFHAARAALMSRGYGQLGGQPLPRTHDGLIGKFSQEFVKSNDIALDIGVSLKQIENRRNVAEYSGERIDANDVPNIIIKATLFVGTVTEIIDRKSAR